MLVGWVCFAIATEVDVSTDSALVADAGDICLARLAVAKGTITVDSMVTAGVWCWESERLIDRDEPVVVGSSHGRGCVALRADVEVGACEALVTDSLDGLIDVS